MKIVHPVTVAIIEKELKIYFTTAVGYVFVTIFLFTIGYLTFEPGRGAFFLLRSADLNSFFYYLPWPLLFLVPAVTMRLWAEERKTKTIELLFTLPVKLPHAVWGKFLAGWLFLIFVIICTFPIILTVTYLGSPDLKVIFLGYLGAILLAGAYLSIGNFFSALTKSQVVSFILSGVFCWIFTMASSPPVLEFLSTMVPRFILELIQSLSILNHYESFTKGIFRLGDLWFFLVMICAWVFMTMFILDERKAE